MQLGKQRLRRLPAHLARASTWPIWRLASADKLVASRTLNLFGGQLLRILVAHGLHRALRAKPHRTLAAHCEELDRNGILKIEDFLDRNLFERVQALALARIEDLAIPRATHHHGPTIVEHLALDELPEVDRAALEPWLNHDDLLSIVRWAERRRIDAQHGAMILERVRFGEPGRHDPETVLHSDIFFPTHKVWLYLSDVSAEDGPLVYVERSHRLSLARLSREYDNSIRDQALSRRISSEELAELGLRERSFAVPGNTLVIADTSGYHRRSVANQPRQRLALHMSFRFNPFARGTPRLQRASTR